MRRVESLAVAVESRWRRQRDWLRPVLAVLAFATLTGVTFAIAQPRMFTGWMQYDDEGYMLTALRYFVDHGSLYDGVFSQYGPFYFEFWGGLASLFGIPIDHDSGRTATYFAWVLTGLIAGLATMRIAASVLAGLLAQALTFTVIGTLVNEPMHPGGLICVLLACTLAAAAWVGGRRVALPLALLGALAAALSLVKINVGILALAAIVLAFAWTFAAGSARTQRWIRTAVGVLFVLAPVVLVTGKLGEVWAREYALHVMLAALALVLAMGAVAPGEERPRRLGWFLAGFGALLGVSILGILATGTSASGVVEGVLIQPLRQPATFDIPLQISAGVLVLDGVAVALALWFRFAARGGVSPALSGALHLFSIGVGAAMALLVIGRTQSLEAALTPGSQLGLLAFAWVALVPLAGRQQPEASPLRFGRLLLPALATMQALHAYPVAGSQIAWSAFLLIPVAALCIANGVRGLVGLMQPGRERLGMQLAAAGAGLLLAAFFVNVTLREPMNNVRATYSALEPMGLPGSSIRLYPEERQLYAGVTEAITSNCTELLMLPGMGSFYLWSEIEPPTGFNATAWSTLFDDEQERKIVTATEGMKGLCLLRNPGLAVGWSGGADAGPLVRELERGFEPVTTVGEYELLKRSRSGAASS